MRRLLFMVASFRLRENSALRCCCDGQTVLVPVREKYGVRVYIAHQGRAIEE